jgi:hypothetical protein
MDEQYGRWTVLDPNEPGRGMLCACQCGTIARINRDDLTGGKSTSCGCYRREYLRGRVVPELAPTERGSAVVQGARFGRLVVTRATYSVPGAAHRMADVRCDCGVEKTVVATHLTGGRKIKSCGCLRRDSARAVHRAAPVSAK